MRGVTALAHADIDQVAELHNLVFLPSRPMSPALLQRYRDWLTTVFLENRTGLPVYQALVCRDGEQVVGFLGMAGRRYRLGGQGYIGTLHSNFIVHPAQRGRGVGRALFGAYLDLPRDFAFVDEVVEQNRALHEHLGMAVSPMQSVRWILPLRPMRRLASMVVERFLPDTLGSLSLLPADAVDGLLRRLPRRP